MEKSIKGRRTCLRRAFTIVELMVVIAVIGLLALLAVPNFMVHLRNAQRTKCIANMSDIRDATYAYLADHANESLPDFSDDFITDTLPRLGYLRCVPKCPRGGKYSYVSDTKKTVNNWQGTGAVGITCSAGSGAGHTMQTN